MSNELRDAMIDSCLWSLKLDGIVVPREVIARAYDKVMREPISELIAAVERSPADLEALRRMNGGFA
jgi:hypothetical protein